MGKAIARRMKKKNNRIEWSKLITFFVVLCGFIIVQECLALMFYTIKNDYTSTAAWLTAAVGLGETVIGTGLTSYLSLCKSDHKEGGITFEAARAKDFTNITEDDPIDKI